MSGRLSPGADRPCSTIKLALRVALSKHEGRFSRRRIRTLVPHLDARELDALVTSLYDGGRLQLRPRDNTYRRPSTSPPC